MKEEVIITILILYDAECEHLHYLFNYVLHSIHTSEKST